MNNAGISEFDNFTEDLSRDGVESNWRKTMNTNLTATIDGTRLGVSWIHDSSTFCSYFWSLQQFMVQHSLPIQIPSTNGQSVHVPSTVWSNLVAFPSINLSYRLTFAKGWLFQVQLMRRTKVPGVIVNIASASGLYPAFAMPIYSSSKGLQSFWPNILDSLWVAQRNDRLVIVLHQWGKCDGKTWEPAR